MDNKGHLAFELMQERRLRQTLEEDASRIKYKLRQPLTDALLALECLKKSRDPRFLAFMDHALRRVEDTIGKFV